MLTLDRQTDIIARGEQLDVVFKINRIVYALYGLANEEIAVVEGKK